MSNSFPAEIVVDESPTGVLYRLPRRPLGAYRYFRLAWILLGSVLLIVAFVPICKFIEAVRGAIPPGQDLAWLFACIVAIGFAVGGIAIMRFGFLILAGHSEVALRDGVLYAIERCGPFRRTRQRAVAGLRRFYVSGALEALNVFGKVSAGPLGSSCVITPEWEATVGGKEPKTLWLALGYPRDWLVEIANDLARRCSTAMEAKSDSPWRPERSSPALPVLEKAPDFSNYEELEEQPAGSRVVVERARDGLSLSVPPLSTRQILARIFAGLFVCFVAFGITLNLFSANGAGDHPVGDTALIVAVAWLAGVILLLNGVHRARNSAVLLVDGSGLTVRQQGIFGWTEREWSREDLADIFVVPAAGDSDEDAWQLQIQPRSGKRGAATLLACRDIAELRWVATLLRRALQLPDEGGSLPGGIVVRSTTGVLRSR
jgi:hypothetical protein